MSSLIWVHTFCIYTYSTKSCKQIFAADLVRWYFHMRWFCWCFKGRRTKFLKRSRNLCWRKNGFDVIRLCFRNTRAWPEKASQSFAGDSSVEVVSEIKLRRVEGKKCLQLFLPSWLWARIGIWCMRRTMSRISLCIRAVSSLSSRSFVIRSLQRLTVYFAMSLHVQKPKEFC